MRLTGKSALVTGAGSGIGWATAIALAREGAAVLLTDIDEAGGQETLARIDRQGGKAAFLRQDVTQEPEWEQAVAQAVRLHGHLDTLVNNAGIGTGQMILEMSLEAWNRQVAINLTGVFLGVKHAVPAIRAHGKGGSLIHISSVAGLEGSAGLAGYCATKGGVRLFSKAAAKEFAADRIRSNSVHPGIIDTPISESTIVGAAVGMALAGCTPVVELRVVDFALCAIDEVVNQAAKNRYMFGGQGRVPMVMRSAFGSPWLGRWRTA